MYYRRKCSILPKIESVLFWVVGIDVSNTMIFNKKDHIRGLLKSPNLRFTKTVVADKPLMAMVPSEQLFTGSKEEFPFLILQSRFVIVLCKQF